MEHSVLILIALLIISVGCIIMAVVVTHLLDLVKDQATTIRNKERWVSLQTKSMVNSNNEMNGIDHAPFIKTAIEIVRMRRRLDKSEIKDKKHLQKSLERLEEYFRERGYEIINHEGARYDEGMRVVASFIPSEELAKGERIITKVIKPQINYKNLMIHSAEVEVSIGD